MGCIYACTCGGFCLGCKLYTPEQYYGHTEDLAAQVRGYNNYDEMLNDQACEEEHLTHKPE